MFVCQNHDIKVNQFQEGLGCRVVVPTIVLQIHLKRNILNDKYDTSNLVFSYNYFGTLINYANSY